MSTDDRLVPGLRYRTGQHHRSRCFRRNALERCAASAVCGYSHQLPGRSWVNIQMSRDQRLWSHLKTTTEEVKGTKQPNQASRKLTVTRPRARTHSMLWNLFYYKSISMLFRSKQRSLRLCSKVLFNTGKQVFVCLQ